MAQQTETTASIEVAPGGDHGAGHAEGSVLDVSGTMVLWTWVTFILMTAVLYKYAWKPILNGLEKREETIQRAMDEADRARQELERITESERKIISEADDKAKEIVTGARKAATEAARVIEDKAKEESNILIENAEREIKTLTEKARADLRRESADLAVKLAGSILKEELDAAKSKALTDRLIKDI